MSIAASAIAEVPIVQSTSSAAEAGPKAPPKRLTIPTSDAPLVPEAR